MACLGRYAFLVMTSVILSGGMKMRDEHGMLRGYAFLVMASVTLEPGRRAMPFSDAFGSPERRKSCSR